MFSIDSFNAGVNIIKRGDKKNCPGFPGQSLKTHNLNVTDLIFLIIRTLFISGARSFFHAIHVVVQLHAR
jgi:hypothetical protein